MSESCETCRFFRRKSVVKQHYTVDLKTCRRRAPLVVSAAPEFVGAMWPDAELDDWCGEYFPAPPQTEE